MKKLLYFLSFSMIVSSSWSQTPSGCFSSGNDISFSKAFSNSRGITKGDFDNDGLLDVVVALFANATSNSNYAFLKGLGNGKFDTPISGLANATQTNQIVSADFNGDGNLDIVLANVSSSSVTVQLGNGDGTFGTAVAYTINVPKNLTLGDINEDGTIDIVVSSGNANQSLLGNVGAPETFTLGATFNIAGSVADIRLADMNGDNHLDVVSVGTSGVGISINNAGSLGTFATAVFYPAGAGPSSLTLCDIDNDNDIDVINSNKTANTISVKKNNGSGVLAAAINYNTGTGPEGVEYADINGDGNKDIVVANLSASTMSIFYGSPSGALTLYQTTQCPGSPKALVIGHFNSDSYADIVTAQLSSTYVNSYLGNSTNNYLLPNIFPTGNTPKSISSNDFNGDGKKDLVIANSADNNFQLFIGNGTGSFTSGGTFATGTLPSSIISGDMDGDGDMDVVTANFTTNNISIFYGNGSGGFTAAANISVQTGPIQVRMGNLNGDAYPDLVVANQTTGSISVILSSGATTYNAPVNYPTNASASAIAIFDRDGDTYKDILVGHNATNSTLIKFTNNGSGVFTNSGNVGTALFTSVTAMEAADLDGDTDMDVVLSYSNGIIKIHNINGTGALGTLSTSITSGSSPGRDLLILDVNSDGRNDVVSVYSPTQSGQLVVSMASSSGSDASYALTNGPRSFACEVGSAGIAPGDFDGDGRIDLAVVNETSNSFNIHFNKTPKITAGGPLAFCNGNSVTLTSTPALWYDWDPNGETTQAISATTSGTYFTTTSSSWSNWCSSSSNSLVVSVTAGPSAPTITAGGSTTFCNGGSVVLTSSQPTGNQWLKNGIAIPGATNSTYTATTAGDYTVTYTNAGCTSPPSAIITVITSQTPVITAGGPTTFCTGGSVTLTSNVGTNISWSNGATTPSITVTTAGTYYVTNTVGACPPLTSNSIVVTVASSLTTPTISPSGSVSLCSGNTVTLTSSSATNNIWSTGATTQSIVVSGAGSYFVHLDNGSCTSSNSSPVTVTISSPPSAPTITAGGATTFCTGGSVTLTSSAGNSYLWSNGATTQSINVTTAGSYTVQVTNAAGCQSTASAPTTVTVNSSPATPTVSAGGTTTFCTGGSVTLTSSAGNSYLWSNGATTQSINVTTSGSYTVQVTNAAGCQSAASAPTTVTVNSSPATPTISAGGATTFCTGGSVTLTSSTGNSYLWSNGATTQSINVTTSGSYTVQITNASGCQSTASAPTVVTVDALPATPTISAGGATTFCTGGSVTLTSSAGNSYLWSNGATTQSINVTTSGSYTVQVTNASGCQSTASAPTTVTVNSSPATPTISASGSTTFCAGGSVTLTSSAGTSYLWSNGETTQSINVTTAGSYTVQVTNASGCQSTASAPTAVTVNPLPTTPTITAGGATTFCAGGSVTLTSSAGTFYLWSNGATTQSINVTTAGSYTVQVTNASGCQSVASAPTTITINPSPATPTISAGGATTFCTGGSVTLTSSAGTSYLWSNGATTQSINVTTAGSYTVQVTNASGCQSAASTPTTVTVNALPATPTITPSGSTAICTGGSVTLTSSTGTSYLWSNGATTQSINVTTAGSYTVQVTDANGCQSTASAPTTVTVNPLPGTPTITAGGATTFCSGGSVTLTSSTGTSYLWSTGATTQSINVTTAGSYTVQITDANGCQSTVSVPTTITVNPIPAAPSITASGATTFCAGGAVTLTSSAGTSYLWSNGATTQSINVTTSGSYTVQITNASGCQSTSSSPTVVTVDALPATPTITSSGSTTICAGGSVTLTSSAGTSYLWSNGATTQSINVTTAGSYTVQVTNASGCQSTASTPTTVTVNPLPATPTITAGGATTFCSGGSVTLTSSTGTSYLWSNGETTQSINVTSAGSYTVQITDANDCQSTVSAPTTVTVNPIPATPSITAGGSTTFCTGGSVTLTSSTGISYLWSNGATTQSINVTSAGSYTVQVTNASGCQSAASTPTTVTVNPLPATPTITAGGATTFCTGGSVTLTSSAGTTYLWSNGATTQSINVTAAGSYTVQVTNASGCQSTASAPTTVTVNALPATPTITAGGATTFCAGGSVTLTSSTGTSYLWSNGATTQSINVTTSGSYTVQVTNAASCQSAASAPTTITVNPIPGTPTVTASGSTTICAGQSVTLTSSTGTSYLWSNGATTQSINVTNSGSYTVKVTDGNGCQSLSSAATTVTVNPIPATPTISGSSSFCFGHTVTLTSSTGTSYLWSTGETTQSIVISTGGSYTVQVANAFGCLSLPSSPKNVTMNISVSTPSITPSGPTTFCDGGSVTLTAAPGFFFLWSSGQTTQSITVDTSGTFTVQRLNFSGCQSLPSAPVTVTVNPIPAAPSITASGPTTFCAGGSVTLTSATAAAYLWSNGATTQSITVTTPGSYTVQITDGNGCQSPASAPQNIIVNPNPVAPTITASGATTFCDGGSVTLTSSTEATYLWSTGETTQSISVTTSGSYSVQVTDAAGCSNTSNTSVTVNPNPAVPTITAGGATTFCDGNSVTLTSSAEDDYLWSTGETTQSINVTASGSYSVQVSNAFGCTTSSAVSETVTVNPIPAVPTITASGATTFCSAGGSVVLTSSAATGNLWSTGETTQSITVTTTGSYTVEQILLGCTSGASASTDVLVNPTPTTPTITAGGVTTFCDGNSVVLTSSSATGNLWSTGETTQSITVTTSGSYSVNVIDGPCTSAVSNTINVTVNPIPNVPVVTAGSLTTFCDGGSVILTSSSASGNLWSTGETTQSITVTTAGSYTVEHIALGCTSGPSAAVIVNVNPLPPVPTITASGPTTFCDGESVLLTSSSTVGNLWSTGETTQSITVTTSGAYTVEATNGFGCLTESISSTNVTVNPIPAVPTITASGATTFCSAGGSVVLTSSAATGNLWSTGETTQSITVTTTGSYTVEQILLGCTSGASASTDVLVNPTPTTPTITAASATTFCDGNSVILTSSSTTGNLWSTGETTQSITVTTSGSYSVNVIDGSCTSAVSNTINVTVNPIPAVPTITAGSSTTFCAGGSVTLTSSAATGNLWSTGETTQSITVNASGTYTVNATSLGCTSPDASQTITVNPIPAAPVITAGGPTTFCAGGSVVLTSSISTGNTWSTSETTSSITVSASGSYTVTQTVLGCTSPASAPISVIVNTIPAVPTITANGVTTFCAGGSVVLTSSSPTNNLWSNGATTQSITVNSSGTFLVQVITNGCTSGTSAPKTVTVNTLPPTPTIVTGTTESICAGSSVTLTSSSTGGNLWSTGEITQSITVSSAGNYTVTVTDGNGCASPASTPTVVTVNPIPTAPVVSMSGPITFCSGGSVTLSSSYGSGNLWSGGSTANSITVSSSGTYTVKHTDTNGCISPASAAVTITVNPIPAAPVITASGPTTFCAGGSVTLSSSTPSGNSWSNAELTKDITVNTGGVYSVIYIDPNGCASPSSAPIVVSVLANPATPSITAGGATTICQGSYVTLTSSYTSGNLWSTGGMTQNINVTMSGTYTVTYTNANGCTSTSNPMTVTVIPVSAIPNISSSGSTTICDGASITLTSSDPNSTWSTGATSQTITVTTSGSYSVVGNQTGCPSQPSAPVIVTVNPAPAAPIITPSGPTTICQGDELFLFTSGSGTNTWSTGYVGQVLSVTNSGSYWVTVQNAYGCSSSSVVVPVVVNSNPVVSVDPFEALCTYASPFTMANGSPTGGNYTGDGIVGNIFYPAAAGVGTSIVTYTYFDVNGCSSNAQAIIEVNDCTGIKEHEQASFAVFPNPNNGQFKITSEGSPMDLIIIYDAQGKMVFNQTYSGTFALDFDLNDYSNGVYYIEISSDKEIQERIPLVINH
ncbi:C protein alpha-antigen precursor [compost metagenome]